MVLKQCHHQSLYRSRFSIHAFCQRRIYEIYLTSNFLDSIGTMGNQSSKPAGSQGPPSPVANHSSSSSTTNSLRKELKPQPAHRSHNVNTSVQEKGSHLDSHSHSANSSPSQRQRPDDAMGNEQSRQQAHETARRRGRRRKRGQSMVKQHP